jgi:hypothetical protein
MAHALVHPLTAENLMQPCWRDGRPLAEVVDGFIKPGGRLTAVERLQIYSRSYWFRLIDCVHDDCPGLRALLGREKFSALVRAFLARYPSRSFTLRDLCERLPRFIQEEPRLTAPRTALAHAIARFERAQTVAFDGAARREISPAEIAARPPARLRLALQPYLTLLDLDWPVDDYVLAVKRRDALRAEASHMVSRGPRDAARRQVPPPRRRRTFLAVHRYNGALYYKRLDAPAFKILSALAAGRPLAAAVTAGGRGVPPARLREWTATWMELGWLCRRE